MENKNKVVKILVGAPASGKTSWKLQFLLRNPDYVAVNRDDFRFMFRNQPTTEPRVEDLITELQDEVIVKALNKGLNVIVDNTNLRHKYITSIIELVQFKADVEFMIFDAPLKTLLERDSLRQKKVGEEVLTKMYKQYQNVIDSFPFHNRSKRFAYEDRFVPAVQDKSLPEAVIFDIDGTLAIMGKRSEYDWQRVDIDDPQDVVIEQIEFHKSKGRKILLVSGRDEVCRDKTEYWLNFYNIHFDELLMRPKDSRDKDYRVKKVLYNEQIKDRFHVWVVYDDRLQVIKKAWYELGLFCFNVNQGNKDF
jgi:predicted kinase